MSLAGRRIAGDAVETQAVTCCRVLLSAVFALALVILACQSESPIAPAKNNPPSAEISGSLSGNEGGQIAFDATHSSDPDGDSLTYRWTFGDGERSTNSVALHTYADEGSYPILLIVTDGRGGVDTASAQATVANAAPTIRPLVISTTALRLGSTASVSVSFTDQGLSDVLTASIDWGDQSTSTAATRNATLNHVYQRVGSYFVTLTVRDNDGGVTTQTASVPIVVSVNHAPIAVLQAPATLREGESGLFSARSSSDPDGDSLTYTWRSGSRVSGPSVHYASLGFGFEENGTYMVSVVVTDPEGAADTASQEVTVQNTPPYAIRITPRFQQEPGTAATTQVSFSDSGGLDSHSVTINWGDGRSDTWAGDTVAHSFIHTFASPGSYRVTATVEDDDGAAIDAAAAYPVVVFAPEERRSVGGYDAIDLGTLGGGSAIANDINDRGQVVGSSATPSGATHAFLWQDGELSDLGSLGQESSEAHRINEAGLIAGMVGNNALYYEEYRSAAAVWRGTQGTMIGDLRGYHIAAMQISETGNEEIIWNRGGYEDVYGWLWRGGSWVSLERLWVSAMNSRGQIVGQAPVHSWGEARIYHAFAWESGAKQDLGVLGIHGGCDFDDCSAARATDVNERGQIVGYSTDSLGESHVVLWEGGAIRDLGLVGLAWEPHAVINERGDIAASIDGRSFFRRDVTWREITKGSDSTNVIAINEGGMVLGTTMTAAHEQHVFVWSQALGFVDLGTGPQGFTAGWAVDINARGDVVGNTAPCDYNSYWNYCGWPQDRRAVLWKRKS